MSTTTAAPATSARSLSRLTRRGRLVVTLALVAVSTGLLGLTQPQAFAFGHDAGPATQRITVRPGETLWAIADRVAPNADPRSTIAQLRSINHLTSSTVPAGSVLLVPWPLSRRAAVSGSRRWPPRRWSRARCRPATTSGQADVTGPEPDSTKVTPSTAAAVTR